MQRFGQAGFPATAATRPCPFLSSGRGGGRVQQQSETAELAQRDGAAPRRTRRSHSFHHLPQHADSGLRAGWSRAGDMVARLAGAAPAAPRSRAGE